MSHTPAPGQIEGMDAFLATDGVERTRAAPRPRSRDPTYHTM